MTDNTMLCDIVQTLILRELGAVRRSVEAYPNDASIWILPAGLPNAGGTLVLHLAGNLQHYIGALLGGSAYRRDRPAEFSRRDVPRAELLDGLMAAAVSVERTLPTLTPEMLTQPYPEPIAGHVVTTGIFLVHLASHIAYHLGQLDYHRRVVTGDSQGAGALSVAALVSAAPTLAG
ncbi:MAG: DinB family protein [bacterium]